MCRVKLHAVLCSYSFISTPSVQSTLMLCHASTQLLQATKWRIYPGYWQGWPIFHGSLTCQCRPSAGHPERSCRHFGNGCRKRLLWRTGAIASHRGSRAGGSGGDQLAWTCGPLWIPIAMSHRTWKASFVGQSVDQRPACWPVQMSFLSNHCHALLSVLFCAGCGKDGRAKLGDSGGVARPCGCRHCPNFRFWRWTVQACASSSSAEALCASCSNSRTGCLADHQGRETWRWRPRSCFSSWMLLPARSTARASENGAPKPFAFPWSWAGRCLLFQGLRGKWCHDFARRHAGQIPHAQVASAWTQWADTCKGGGHLPRDRKSKMESVGSCDLPKPKSCKSFRRFSLYTLGLGKSIFPHAVALRCCTTMRQWDAVGCPSARSRKGGLCGMTATLEETI